MIANPYLNAALASIYIVVVVNIVNLAQRFDIPENILIPITMLSLLVLSVATMGYLFFFQPMQMYLDGHKKQAVTFFLTTLGTFATITLVLVFVTFFVVR